MFQTERDLPDVRVPDRVVDQEPPPWPRDLITTNWIHRSRSALPTEAVTKISGDGERQSPRNRNRNVSMGLRPNQRIRLCYAGTVWIDKCLCFVHRTVLQTRTKDGGCHSARCCLRLKFDKRGQEDRFATTRVFAPPTACNWLISVQHREQRPTGTCKCLITDCQSV
jgi:hypothetical protein